MRIVCFARAVGGIKCDAELGLDHHCDPAGETAADLCDHLNLGRDALR